MAEQEQDRSEEASPFKLEEARKRGSVAKSLEFNTLAVLVWSGIAISALGTGIVQKLLSSARTLIGKAAILSFDEIHVGHWLPGVFFESLLIVLPFLLGTVLVGILVNIAQTGGIVLSLFPLKPDIQRLNPVTNFKRLFSIKLLVEAVKTFIKMALLASTLYFLIAGLLPLSPKFFQWEGRQFIRFLIDQSSSLVLKMSAILALVVAIDFVYTRWDFAKQMRMSTREVKEEYKRREGDPRIRQKIRELQRESLRRSGSAQNIKDADVLITNPTHLAIALQYRRGKMDAPKVLTKGAGAMADQLRVLARRYGVPIVENKKLARALFRESMIEQPIRDRHFPEVAKIMVWVFAMRERSGSLRNGALT